MAYDWREYALVIREPWDKRLLRKIFRVRIKCETPTTAPGIEIALTGKF